VNDFFETQLADYERAWQAGSFPHLIMAVMLCAENGYPLPKWTAEAVLEVLKTALNTGAKAGKRGQGSPRRAYAYNVTHHLRWWWASYWLTHRKELQHHGHKPTRDGAFAYTSELLRGTAGRGSADSVKDSYELVRKAIKRGKDVNFGDT
jgi:hypothetical protein